MVNPHPRLPRATDKRVAPLPSVTSKVSAILLAFDQEHPKLGLTELAHRACLPLATTHRIATELVQSKALGKQGKLFHVSSEIWRIGLLAPVQLSLAEIAAPFMQDVLSLTHNVVNLFIHDDTSALLVQRISGTKAGMPFSRVGARMPLHSTAAGKVILAHGDDSLLDRLSFPLKAFTKNTMTTREALEREIAHVRARGFATTREESSQANFGLAVPILLPTGTLVGSLGVVTLNAPAPEVTIVPLLRFAARSIARYVFQNFEDVTVNPSSVNVIPLGDKKSATAAIVHEDGSSMFNDVRA